MGVELVRDGVAAVGEGGIAGGSICCSWRDAGGCPFVSRSGLVRATCWGGMTRKQRGEMAEAAFMARATALGLRVAKPWGEMRYDLIVDNGSKLLRVQVKSAHRAGPYGGYLIQAHGCSTRAYNANEIDLLAAYLVPVDAWYLFPVEEFLKYKSMKLFPVLRRRMSKFERFRENWGIVR